MPPCLRWIARLLLVLAVAAGLAPRPLQAAPTSPPRPGGDAGLTQVGCAAWLGDITKIDSAAQTFSASVVIVLRWQDPRLKHDEPAPKLADLDDIWHPRLHVANATAEPDPTLPENAEVAPDGLVTYRQRLTGEFAQSLNLHAFPFDADIFKVQFVVPGPGTQDIMFTPDETLLTTGMKGGAGLADDFTIKDWSVTSVGTKTDAFRAAPFLELSAFSLEIAAKRRAQHFVIKVIIPLILIVMMSWAVFWIEPTDAGSQMGVSVTAMLTLIAYQFLVDSEVPALPYLTRLDAFILMSSVLVFLSIVEVLLSTKFAHRDRLDLAHALDRKCRWLFPLVFFAGAALTLLR